MRDTDSAELDLARHERKCSVCQHPEREAIEETFLHWHSVVDIKVEFDLPGTTAIYRHAHAYGLFERRARNFRFALEHIFEGAVYSSPSASEVIQAIRAYSRLNDDGKWIDQPTTHMVMVAASPAAPALPLAKRGTLRRRWLWRKLKVNKKRKK
jgi:hypothetical protein